MSMICHNCNFVQITVSTILVQICTMKLAEVQLRKPKVMSKKLSLLVKTQARAPSI